MVQNILNKLSEYEVVSVAVNDEFCNCSYTVNVDDYEVVGNDLFFGNEDQEICIKGIDQYEISE